MCSDKCSLIKKKRRPHVEAKVNKVFSIHHQQVMSRHFPGSEVLGSSTCSSCSIGQMFHNKWSLSSSFCLAFIAQPSSNGMKYSCGQFGLNSSGCFLCQDLAHPVSWVNEGMLERAFMLCMPCSTVAEIMVFYQHLSTHQYKVQHCEGCSGENYFS